MPFEFTTDAWNEFTKKVLEANGDQATLTTLLSDMQDTFTTGITTQGELDKTNKSLKEENGRLKEANMSLFLRVGEQKKDSQEPEKSGEPKPGEEGHAVDKFLDNLYKEK
ncbi:MAG: scaffolding protein [Bacteriophage sp.]|jgi:regulator of replication initiation timing|nr:MAG: scaffolding protein [Bacteriophage sp.]DAW40495.1 MAG TPA: Initiation control protein YabA [Bacteriophage sp.]